jgi:2-isopropylmalate synthase
VPSETTAIFDWNSPAPGERPPGVPRRLVEADDETLRDGLQSPSAKNPPLQSKLEFLRILVKLGVQAVDLGLPAAGPHIREDTLFLAKEIATERLPIEANCAARTLSADIRPILEISQKAGTRIRVATFIGSSAIRQYTEGWDLAFLLKATRDSVTEAVRAGMPVLFVTEDTTRAQPAVLRDLYTAAIDCGADRICLADTVGCATPDGARRLVSFISGVIASTGAKVGIDWHGHMDRGLGISSALAAFDAGASRLHGSAMGLGERVGNTPLDLLLINLRLMGLWEGELAPLSEYVEWVARWTGVPIPWNYPVFGRDAYRTGTGVHAAAILKALQKGDQDLVDIVYSAVPASWFSRQQSIVVGPMSGESNVVFWLRQHGLEPEADRVRVVRRLAKDSDHTLTDDEIFDALARLEKP